MKDDPYKNMNRPFKDLAAMLKRQCITLAHDRRGSSAPPSKNTIPSADNESELFFQAMANVTPIRSDRVHRRIPTRPYLLAPTKNDDNETLTALHRLIQHGQGFIVSQTPEYMEAASPGAGKEILRRLHEGRYAIQDYVDLHGLRVVEAELVLERFIRQSIDRGLRAVLVVHGRGLTSPREPVLKHKVYSWLTRGALRKWVIALTSARSCDGGAGASYVLLRNRPMTKSQRKKGSRISRVE